jgi:hypothetical protein
LSCAYIRGFRPTGCRFFHVVSDGLRSPGNANVLVGDAIWLPDGTRLVVTIFHEVNPSRSPDVELVVVTFAGDGVDVQPLARVEQSSGN